jgi:hypothetical protein
MLIAISPGLALFGSKPKISTTPKPVMCKDLVLVHGQTGAHQMLRLLLLYLSCNDLMLFIKCTSHKHLHWTCSDIKNPEQEYFVSFNTIYKNQTL